jgi:hypothetical protein
MPIKLKTKSVLITATTFTLLSFPAVNFGQAPNLGTAASFVLFSAVGAVSNTGISQLTGNIGTNSGAISSFGNVNGVMHSADAATAQATTDLQAAWYYLDVLAPTLVHGPVLGSGETLYAGVDTIAAAGSIVGTLTFDAQGDPTSVFVIKTGGALTTAAYATINLANGALACNIFWVVEGAISMATFTTMRGTLIAHNAAIDMGAGGTIEGRALSTTGAVSVYGTLAYIPKGCGSTILTGPSAPTLNTVACYALFSSNGAVANSGATSVTGDVGTNQGTTTGYNPASVLGTVHPTPDASTAQCAADLPNVYTYLNTLPYDIELLYPAQFGNKLVLTPHTYRMNAAAILTDTLYLDAEGNTDAVFVFQINAALSTSTYSTVRLINGTQAKNVYWKVEGAVSINDNSTFCGTIICNNGAINLNTGVVLDGRAITTTGIINTIAIAANNSYGGYCSGILPIELLSFTAACAGQNIVLKWSTATEKNNRYFTVERSDGGINWKVIGSVDGADNSLFVHNYSLTDKTPGAANAFYRLEETDFDGNNRYGNVVAAEKCEGDALEILTVEPNPSAGEFVLSYSGDKSQVLSIVILSIDGREVYESMGFQSNFDLSNKAQGVYFVQVHLHSKTINREIIIAK